MNTETHTCSLLIDNELFSFDVVGAFFIGESETLYKSKGNILEKTDWEKEGYKIVSIFDDNEMTSLITSVKENIFKGLQLAGAEVSKKQFKIEDYHKYITNDDQHLKVIHHTRSLTNKDFKVDFENLALKFSEHTNTKLTSYIKELKSSHIQIRISRPNSLDINPPHRDGYLSYWKNILNVWIPIAGCNKNSSLPLIPESHLIPENKIIRTNSKGAYINGNQYYVPCIIKTTDGDFKMIRPNPKEKEALIFSPFLIHGAAVNKNKNITRVALELRFDKKEA
ncbi:phytanoyl-CoA dioxygenase family protein [Aquimarina agarivorans]|uniref:phytanoyl-CoA dioxygenase family protein n=1 Tax=Aquimarina agarivorans TaxID=980584 RepID=UPI000248E989|nr:phytanoyl-CoA dioxygenase family protein [Aquimarina agarivorans]